MPRFGFSVAGAAGSFKHLATIIATVMILWGVLSGGVHANEPEWIWATGVERDAVPESTCYFRKSFSLEGVQNAKLSIAADDRYELFVNGRRVGSGESWDDPDTYEISRYLLRGKNVIAVKATNTDGNTAALAVAVQFTLLDDEEGYLVSDDTWLTSMRAFPLWSFRIYNDRGWGGAQSFGLQRNTPPWIVQDQTPTLAPPPSDASPTVAPDVRPKIDPEMDQMAAAHGDFTIPEEFAVELVMDRVRTGSLIALAFREFGEIICSREDGPLMMVFDKDKDSVPDTIRVWCDKVQNCQGILALNGDVYVTGKGPRGPGLYRISDKDRDGRGDDVTTLIQFTGEMGEYGPHGLSLGPDGLIYVVLGNQSAPVSELSLTSSYRNYYEGDLPQPRLENSDQQAEQAAAPGGTIIRTNITGDFVDAVAGGLRNAYGLAFDRYGQLVTADGDTETDTGLPWYRSPRILRVNKGAEFGWRSGWAAWPEYFVDSVPSIGTLGPGAPTGMVFYDHFAFPARFHGSLFLGDWKQSRIYAVKMVRTGAGTTTDVEVFAQGNPMNVTDLAVGPDGGLYFTTGGRDTPGGLYRIVWDGEVPETARNLGTGMAAAIRQPQMHSAWSRQMVAAHQMELGDKWGPQLTAVARSERNPTAYRTRALDLMQLFGPSPDHSLLTDLSEAKDPVLRAKVATLMGVHANAATRKRLVELLGDDDPLVRSKSCEALVESGGGVWSAQVEKMLTSTDRFEAWAARRMVERVDPEIWEGLILYTREHPLFIQGATAMLVARPEKEKAKRILDRISTHLEGYVSDEDFVDILRVTQLALLRGELTAADVPKLRDQLTGEFPAADHVMNRELARLLVYLDVTSIGDRYVAYLNKKDVPAIERLHLGLHLSRLEGSWKTQDKFELLKFYETAYNWQGHQGYRGYVRQAARGFVASLTDAEKRLLLAQGEKLPNAAFAVLSGFPEKLDAVMVESVKALDKRLADIEGDAVKPLKIATVAVLARSGDGISLAYLRDVFDRQPARRHYVALGLAQVPGDEHWEYLARSLRYLDGSDAIEVVHRLTKSERAPDNPEPYGDLIVLGLTLQGEGSGEICKLLEKWSGESISQRGGTEALAAWRQWFTRQYPDAPALRPIASKPREPSTATRLEPTRSE